CVVCTSVFINEDGFGGIEFELVLEPGLAPLQDVGPIPLRRVRGLFLNVRPQGSRKGQMVHTLALMSRSAASRCCISMIVMSGVCSTRPNRKSRCGSSFERRGWP